MFTYRLRVSDDIDASQSGFQNNKNTHTGGQWFAIGFFIFKLTKGEGE